MLSILMQSLVVFCLLGVLWAVYGYSLAFHRGGAFFGSLDKLFLKGRDRGFHGRHLQQGRGDSGIRVHRLPADLCRPDFRADHRRLCRAHQVLRRAGLRGGVVHLLLPAAGAMVWYWAGPDAYTTAEAGAKAGETAGFLFQKGALDFAGGTVVHINAGVAALVGALIIGKRVGCGRDPWPRTARP